MAHWGEQVPAGWQESSFLAQERALFCTFKTKQDNTTKRMTTKETSKEILHTNPNQAKKTNKNLECLSLNLPSPLEAEEVRHKSSTLKASVNLGTQGVLRA